MGRRTATRCCSIIEQQLNPIVPQQFEDSDESEGLRWGGGWWLWMGVRSAGKGGSWEREQKGDTKSRKKLRKQTKTKEDR